MGCECTMRSPANVVCQHQIMSTEFDVGGLPNALCNHTGACIYVLRSCLPHNEALTARVQ